MYNANNKHFGKWTRNTSNIVANGLYDTKLCVGANLRFLANKSLYLSNGAR